VAESLETRRLLSSAYGTPTAVVRGTDPDGAQWTLRLYGPGTLNVVDQNGAAFTRATASTMDSIDTITVGGSITSETKLVGTVTPAPDGNANVYFQNLVVTPTGELGKIDTGQVSNFRVVQNGISAIDMPDFYLAHTSSSVPTKASTIHTTASGGEVFQAGLISIPGGVNTLRFGGVDADYAAAGATPLTDSNQSNEFDISLGLPVTTGTSIIVNSVTSDSQTNTTSGSPAFQDMVTFLVAGRLNLFQANTINGNAATGLAPSQFASSVPTTLSPGGTFVISDASEAGTGQIGNVRVGGNATNFTTLVDEYALSSTPVEGALDAKISNFFIGGQTNNVMLMAPSGSRNISFGLGMDNVTINSLAVSSLRANRDATNSTVTVSRSIQNLFIGGPVENTNIQTGEYQSLFTDTNYPPTSALTAGSGVFYGTPPPTVTNPQVNAESTYLEPFAQNGGSIAGRIAGNITNSVISASVDNNPSGQIPTVGDAGTFEPSKGEIFPFGAPDNLVLPRGVINLKFEGVVNNSFNPLVSPSANVNSAFFARTVHIKKGPVIPPNVPSAPYVAPTVYTKGQDSLKGLIKLDHVPSNLRLAHIAEKAASIKEKRDR
jgi:hypothetical protein